MTSGLALDIAGIFMLWRQFDVKKWRKENQENGLPDVPPEKEFILLLSPRCEEIGIWQLTINFKKTNIGICFLIVGLAIQMMGVWMR